MRPIRRFFLRLLLTTSVLGVLTALCMELWLRSFPNYGKPLGQDIPSQPPSEADRVVNSHGFSLIFPPNWEVLVEASDRPPQILNGFPRSLIPRRYSAIIFIGKFGEQKPFDTADCQSIEFQGQPAFESVSKHEGVLLERPPSFSYAMCFQRDGVGYRMNYTVGRELDSLPPIIRRYFETFRVE